MSLHLSSSTGGGGRALGVDWRSNEWLRTGSSFTDSFSLSFIVIDNPVPKIKTMEILLLAANYGNLCMYLVKLCSSLFFFVFESVPK